MTAIDDMFRKSATEVGLTEEDIKHAEEAWRQTSAGYGGMFSEQVVELIKSGFYAGYAHGRAH